MIFRPPFFLPWLYPNLYWRVPTKEKTLFLTFDDGPVPGPTEFVLEQLQKFDARATFFCIGDNVRKHPAIFSKVLSAGHSIGNHTFHHLNGWKYSAAEYTENIRQCEIEFLTHGLPLRKENSVKFFRPPYGKLKNSQIASLKDYKIVMWDVLSRDFSHRYSPEECLKGSVRNSRPGSIVVFHDSLKAEPNMVYALPRLLEHFAGLGYSFRELPNG